MSNPTSVSLGVTCDAHLARLVRMTAANVATLSNMSVERVEDIRMAAEEAFIYACSATPGRALAVEFDVDPARVSMTFRLDASAFSEPDDDETAAVYMDLILGSVCDTFEKRSEPAALFLEFKADL